jgi:hypothetical protein
VLGTPVDLGKVSCDSFVVAGYTDHLIPWDGAYRTTQLLGGESHRTNVGEHQSPSGSEVMTFAGVLREAPPGSARRTSEAVKLAHLSDPAALGLGGEIAESPSCPAAGSPPSS